MTQSPWPMVSVALNSFQRAAVNGAGGDILKLDLSNPADRKPVCGDTPDSAATDSVLSTWETGHPEASRDPCYTEHLLYVVSVLCFIPWIE